MSANSLRHKATLKEYLMKYVTVSLSIYKLTHRSGQQLTGSAVGNSQGKKVSKEANREEEQDSQIHLQKIPMPDPCTGHQTKHWTAANCRKEVAVPGAWMTLSSVTVEKPVESKFPKKCSRDLLSPHTCTKAKSPS